MSVKGIGWSFQEKLADPSIVINMHINGKQFWGYCIPCRVNTKSLKFFVSVNHYVSVF